MNKRQAKKAFKKKYGMNPGEAAKLLNEIDFTKVMQQVTEAINDFAKKLPEILDGMAKTIRAAVEQIDTEQLRKRSLEQRERITRHAEKALVKAVKLQNEQIKLTQHLLNGQKLRYFAMNKQAEEIEQSLEEVKKIASGFNGAGKGSGRNLKK